MSHYLAHISEDGREQTVLEHLKGTARRCADYAGAFGAREQGKLAGLAHDVGKYSKAFQDRLRGDPQRVDHSTAGAYACLQAKQLFAAFAVAGHHGGLPDGGSATDSGDSATFFGRMNRAKAGRLPPCEDWRQELALPPAIWPDWARDPMEGMFFTRMLFSCLVDADYSDTSEFMSGQPEPPSPAASMEELWRRLEQYISGWFPAKTPLNARRCAILEQCIRAGKEQAPGLFTLTVPTGGGKTVASLAFALAQARAQGLRRVVYVIPYTSIIEQTAQTFRDILGEEQVLEHHSGVLFDLEDEASPQSVRLARATETWDVPVVVTTAVQFFESLFACKPSQCRKLHNLAGSVVVFDEAQMLPIPYLRPCVWAIAQLARHYRVSAVLCTATQPALSPLFRAFAPELPITELCPLDLEEWDAFRRVTFRRVALGWDRLAGALMEQEQVLCVVNSRKNAQEIFRRLEGEGRFHLSTLMCPAHRRARLEEIRQRLKEGLPCRVVSTSLIEAGVDVDFPTVYREEAGLDSILQAAGRCNREGKRPAGESLVNIFRRMGQTPPLFEIPIAAGRFALDRFPDPAAPEAVHAYFHDFLNLMGEQFQDRQDILPAMASGRLPFRTVAERFHLIDSPTRTVYIPVGEGRALVDRLRAGERSRGLFRQLGQYGVSVYEGHFAALERAGALEVLEGETAVLADAALYSPDTGLSLEADSGRGLFI